MTNQVIWTKWYRIEILATYQELNLNPVIYKNVHYEVHKSSLSRNQKQNLLLKELILSYDNGKQFDTNEKEKKNVQRDRHTVLYCVVSECIKHY